MRVKRRLDVRPSWIAAAVALLTVLAFLPALRNGFAWDDELNFVGNPYYRGLGWAQLRWMFGTAYLGPYQPLSWLSSGLDYVLWGLRPLGYHAVNLLLHAVNAVLVYRIVLRLLKPDAPKDELKAALCAAAGALLFSVHPLRVEAVAWATERRTVLAGFFYLSAILCYLELGMKRGIVAALFAASLLSKGIGVTLPVTLLALDVYPLRKTPDWRGKIPLFLIAAGFGLVELVSYSHYLPAGPEYGPWARVARAGFALVFYAVKTVLPFGLSPVYEYVWPFPICVAALAGLTWLLWRERERWPFGLPAWTHYVAALFPVLGLFKFGEHAVADRYSYLACAVAPVLAAGGLWSLERDRRLFRGALAGTAAVIAGLCLLTWTQTAVWHDSVTLWSHATSVEPGSLFARKSLGRAHYNAGNAFLQHGRPREAEAFYLNALKADPALAMAHNNLGVLQLKYGSPREAAACFCRALKVDPSLSGVAANLRGVLGAFPKLAQGLDEDCRRFLTKPE